MGHQGAVWGHRHLPRGQRRMLPLTAVVAAVTPREVADETAVVVAQGRPT
ncbi:hypothetical protein [Streptomyces sp. NPDC054804]